MDHFVDLSNFCNIFAVIFKMVQVHAGRWGFHLELVHSGLGLGDVELVAVLAGHNDFLLFL